MIVDFFSFENYDCGLFSTSFAYPVLVWGIGRITQDKYLPFEENRMLDSFFSNIFSVWTFSKPFVLFMFALYTFVSSGCNV